MQGRRPKKHAIRQLIVSVVAGLALMTTACGAGGGAEETAVLDQFVIDWNSGDPDVAFNVFGRDGSLVFIGEPLLVGEEEIVPKLGRHLHNFAMERTGDAVEDGEGGFEFDVAFINRGRFRTHRTLVVTMDGDIPHMVENYSTDSPVRRD